MYYMNHETKRNNGLFLAAVLLLLIYLAAGSAPRVFGLKLYNFQELYLLSWMGFWESCVQIGLMPSNSGYGAIFTGSALRAEIVDTEGRVVYRSSERDREGSGLVYRCAPVHGGEVRWTEDHRVMDRMNAELAEAASQIEEENELIAEENRILPEQNGPPPAFGRAEAVFHICYCVPG